MGRWTVGARELSDVMICAFLYATYALMFRPGTGRDDIYTVLYSDRAIVDGEYRYLYNIDDKVAEQRSDQLSYRIVLQ